MLKNATSAQFDFLYHTMFPVKKKGRKQKSFRILPQKKRDFLLFFKIESGHRKNSPFPGGEQAVESVIQLSIKSVSKALIWR